MVVGRPCRLWRGFRAGPSDGLISTYLIRGQVLNNRAKLRASPQPKSRIVAFPPFLRMYCSIQFKQYNFAKFPVVNGSTEFAFLSPNPSPRVVLLQFFCRSLLARILWLSAALLLPTFLKRLYYQQLAGLRLQCFPAQTRISRTPQTPLSHRLQLK